MYLYVKFAQEKKPRTVREFLKKFYHLSDGWCLKGYTTYSDSECKRSQSSHSYRSFDDLLILVKTYYPSITDKKLIHYLLTTDFKLSENIKAYPHLGVCSGMGKIRFIPYKELNVSYDLDIRKRMLNSKNTWNELLKLIGIKNEYQFKEYIKNRK